MALATVVGERRPGQLIDRDRSCLVVIDVQRHFLEKLPAQLVEPLVERIAWLVQVANALRIPIITTAEQADRNGSTVSAVADLLAEDAPPDLDKKFFGLYGQDDIRQVVKATGRDIFVLVGLETDVCVAHSALGLQAAGFGVAVVEDACASPPPHHADGIRRLRDAGVTVTSTKGIYYEWVRDLDTLAELSSDHLRPPPGLTL